MRSAINIILAVLVLVEAYIIVRIYKKEVQPSVIYRERIDSLYIIVDSLVTRDSVIYKDYEKDSITICNQSCADDYVFFTEYLKARFPDLHNADSIKAN